MASIRRLGWDLLAVIPGGLLLFAGLALVLAPQSGPLGLALILEPHLFIATLVILAPVAIIVRARRLGVVLLAVAIAGGSLFGSEWVSAPWSSASRHDLTVMTWNVQFDSLTPAETAAALEGVTADVVALQELEPDPAAAVEANAAITARYPYRAMAPRRGAWGVAVLSRYPIRNVESAYPPAVMELIVDTPRGPVRVINGHPFPPAVGTVTPFRLPIGFDPAYRNSEISVIRGRIDAALAAGDRLLVLGDFNSAPSEPEYRVLTAGLRDTHVEVGEGPGWTWRPSRFTFLPIGFLRIDLQLTAGRMLPSGTSIDCSVAGDHCRLLAAYQID